MLAKNVRATRSFRQHALSLTSIVGTPPGACSLLQDRDRPFTGQAMSRNSRRRILPTGVIGNDSRSTMCLGTLYAVKFSLQ